MEDPDFKKRQQAALARREVNRRQYLNSAAGVLTDLHAAGYNVEAVGDLRSSGAKYESAIPVLIEWLPRVEDRYVKEDIIRTLSVPWARTAAAALLLEFARMEEGDLRWAVGNALEAIAHEAIADELLRLATNKRYGRDRSMIVQGLAKLKHPVVHEALLGLLEDEDVAPNALMALGRRNDPSVVEKLTPFLGDYRPWVRKEAQKAIDRLKRVREKSSRG